MTRTDNDTWDLASSVGVTATMVAAARAVASNAADPLISDPYAEPLVRAVGLDLWTRIAAGDIGGLAPDAGRGISRMADNMAVRTKFFDDFFRDAGRAGIRQAVILASGLDARAYRLEWPAGTTVYEIDQPEVIEFKTRTLDELGAAPTAQRRTVAVDLRFDWPSALVQAGFDPSAPTAWSAEGLLGYLPPRAQDTLLDTVSELSAPGSRVAIESTPRLDPADHAKTMERINETTRQWRESGFDLDMAGLVYMEERNDPADYLTERGWTFTRQTVKEMLVAGGLAALDEHDEEELGALAEMQYSIGILG
jgi:methyltransferase (TIGR00027 family)